MNTAAIRHDNDSIGQVVDGKFTLLNWLGNSGQGDVFLTELDGQPSQKAVIKLIRANAPYSESQMAGWSAVQRLSHPHLMRLFHVGSCQINGNPMFYAVMEYAEENLSQILPDRPLTPAETKEMLDPLLDALSYVHGKGLVHGHLKPSNIMVVNDQLKLSCDGIQAAGPTPGIHRPSPPTMHRNVPHKRFLQPQIYGRLASAWLKPLPNIRQSRINRNRRNLWFRNRFRNRSRRLRRSVSGPTPLFDANSPMSKRVWTRRLPSLARRREAQQRRRRYRGSQVGRTKRLPQREGGACEIPHAGDRRRSTRPVSDNCFSDNAVASNQSFDHATICARSRSSPTQSPAPESPASSGTVKGAIASQVLPDVSETARNTIHGTVKVKVKAEVDPSGSVSNATLESMGPSRYFSGRALEATQQWKFKPPQVNGKPVSSIWTLQFEFRQTGTTVRPVETSATPYVKNFKDWTSP